MNLESGVPLILSGHTTSMNSHMHQNSIMAMMFDSSSTYLILMADEDDAPLLWDLSARGEDWTWNKKQAFDYPQGPPRALWERAPTFRRLMCTSIALLNTGQKNTVKLPDQSQKSCGANYFHWSEASQFKAVKKSHEGRTVAHRIGPSL